MHDLKAWKLIDEAGCRGLRRGGAVMSEKHSNFLVNDGGATAVDGAGKVPPRGPHGLVGGDQGHALGAVHGGDDVGWDPEVERIEADVVDLAGHPGDRLAAARALVVGGIPAVADGAGGVESPEEQLQVGVDAGCTG